MTTFQIIPDTTHSFQIGVVSNTTTATVSVIAGALGPQGDSGVAYATSPILYNSGTKTVSFDQTAQNVTNDSRYFKRSGDTIDAGTIV